VICLLTNQIPLNQKMERFAEEQIVIVVVVIISKRERMGEDIMSCTHHCFHSDTSLILCSKNVIKKQTEKVIDTYAEYSQELPSFLSPLVTCCALWQCVLEACTPGNNVCHSLHKDIHCSHQCVSLYVNVG